MAEWNTCPSEVREFIEIILADVQDILEDRLTGLYLHGSLAMGGFNPNRSDIDLLGVTRIPLTREEKMKLANMFVAYSSNPYPVEVSFFNESQLMDWSHPSRYDFHYSEFWRTRYVKDLSNNTFDHIDNHDCKDAKDPDLAAHVMVTNRRGICLVGSPISKTFPEVKLSDYWSAILSDFNDCLLNIGEDPIYCVLNIIRVYRYALDGEVTSKEEAGQWAMTYLPEELRRTVHDALKCYSGDVERMEFDDRELFRLRDYLQQLVLR